MERCIPELPLSKLCSVPFSLQNRALFEGEKRAKRCQEKGRKRGGQQRGAKRKKGRVKTGQFLLILDDFAGDFPGRFSWALFGPLAPPPPPSWQTPPLLGFSIQNRPPSPLSGASGPSPQQKNQKISETSTKSTKMTGNIRRQNLRENPATPKKNPHKFCFSKNWP